MRLILVTALVVVAFAASFALRTFFETPPGTPETTSTAWERIICLSPGLTETAFALGLDRQVVGITRFCLYPPEAQHLPRVGGYLDPNYEAIVGLHPDAVLLTPYHIDHYTTLERLGVTGVVIAQDSLADIRESYRILGRLCGRESRAENLIELLDASLKRVRAKVADQPPLQVLMTTGRDVRSGALDEVYAIGPDTFLSELLALAGGENIVSGRMADYPALSAEGILNLNPDVIIELAPDAVPAPGMQEKALAPWRALTTLNAVQNNRLYLLTGAYLTIPGPRTTDTLEALVRCLHGETPS